LARSREKISATPTTTARQLQLRDIRTKELKPYSGPDRPIPRGAIGHFNMSNPIILRENSGRIDGFDRTDIGDTPCACQAVIGPLNKHYNASACF